MTSSIQKGTIVQIVAKPDEYGCRDSFYGMIGTVFAVRPDGKQFGVFFAKPKQKLRGYAFAYAEEDLAAVGVSAVEPDYDAIKAIYTKHSNRINKLRRRFVDSYNRKCGTAFKSFAEFMEDALVSNK